MSTPYDVSDDMPLYVISVAARLAGLRRTGSDNRSGLVPVRDSRLPVWEPTTGPSSEPGPSRGDR